jgi:hypothetical protein
MFVLTKHETYSYFRNMSIAHMLTRFVLGSLVMSQNLRLTPPADSAFTRAAQGLVQCGYLGFRFVRYQCSPWFALAIAPLKLLLASDVERTDVRVRYFRAIARIDFVRVYRLLYDLLW